MYKLSSWRILVIPTIFIAILLFQHNRETSLPFVPSDVNIEIQHVSGDLDCLNPDDQITFRIINRGYSQPSTLGTLVDNNQLDIGGMTTITWSAPDINGVVSDAASTDGGTVTVIMEDPADADANSPASGNSTIAMLSNSLDPNIDDSADEPCVCYPGSVPGENSCPINNGTCNEVSVDAQVDWIFNVTYTVPQNSNYFIGNGSVIDGQSDYLSYAGGNLLFQQTVVYSSEAQFNSIDVQGVGCNAGDDQAVNDVDPGMVQIYTLSAETPPDPNCTGTWTGAPAGSSFTPDANAHDAVVTFPAGTDGPITLTWSVDCGGTCVASDQMVISIALPIDLMSFDGKKTNDFVNLTWVTAIELDNDFFEIERSFDGKVFSVLKKIEGKGNNRSNQSYKAVDESPQSGINYYRLKQVDYDGNFTYSKIISVQFNETESHLILYPNPVNETLFWDYGPIHDEIQIRILDVNGRTYFNHVYKRGSLVSNRGIDVSDLDEGVYLMELIEGKGASTQISRFIKENNN